MNNDENASGSATQTPPSDFEPPSLRPPPITVYKARRPRKGFGWKRAILWTFGAVLAIGIGVAGVTAWFVYDRLEKVTTLTGDPQLQVVSHHLDLPIAGKPVTVLVLGYDHRSWEKTTKSRSDTMILMRLDPHAHSLTVLSMPRDMRVDIPGHGIDKLNAAYSIGGAELALDTVRQTMDVKINYLITVDFTGFRSIVDHVGGVYTDVERRYYNLNGQAGSGDYSNIDLKAGYQLLQGAQALSYVRFRHQDNDIYRITRQQAFLRELKHKLDLTTVGTNFVSLVNDVANNVKIVSQFKHKPGPKTLIGFARALAEVPKSRTLQLKLLGDQGGGGTPYVIVGAPEIQSTVAEFLNPDFKQSITASDVGGKLVGPGSTKKPVKPAISPKLLKVVTLNGSGVDLASATAAAALRNVGYTHAAKGILAVTGNGDTKTPTFQTTKVYYTTKRAKSAAQQAAGRAVRRRHRAGPGGLPQDDAARRRRRRGRQELRRVAGQVDRRTASRRGLGARGGQPDGSVARQGVPLQAEVHPLPAADPEGGADGHDVRRARLDRRLAAPLPRRTATGCCTPPPTRRAAPAASGTCSGRSGRPRRSSTARRSSGSCRRRAGGSGSST